MDRTSGCQHFRRGSPGPRGHHCFHRHLPVFRAPHLNDLWERNGESTHQYWTLAKPAYVQTHKQTFSGAEEFSYNLKNLKRATIIGETTGGGAHPISGHRIDDHFMIGVPFARTINPSPQPTGKERVSSPP
ncbi:MAG: hypothetical protein DMG54_22620 [Acidobacteria bacterium]|nr:MAG: hypothetical protein DMG54_22620 [Acidobacteriota bacterium]PYU76671.1 MAG: hypothetical protein DMG52_03285 [Acidobacteriota bacterium]